MQLLHHASLIRISKEIFYTSGTIPPLIVLVVAVVVVVGGGGVYVHVLLPTEPSPQPM